MDKLLEIKPNQNIEQSVKKKQKKEFKKIGSIMPKRGHQLWEINEETGEVKLAEFKHEKNVSYETATKKVSKKVIIKPKCVYISSLNSKSALKRWEQGKGSAQIEKGIIEINK